MSIHDRPKEADGTRFGDWEPDLIVDKHSNAILTLVERSTNYLLAEKLSNGKKAKPLAKVVWRLLAPFKGFALKTITTDNGSEFAEHEWISKRLNVPIYFADSYCAWQKGAEPGPQQTIYVNVPSTQASNGLGIAGMVIAILSLFFGWIPGLGWIIWILGTLFSFIGIFRKPRGCAIAGLIISFIGLIFLLFIVGAIAAAIGLS